VGGGIVFFVDREEHMYIRGVEEREEAGTPSIVGAIRAGMVFQLKEAVTEEVIGNKEEEIIRYEIFL
jgi:selenocysteine lyase/cysteine desulfurase